MANIRDVLANNLKENRRRCGLTQEKLAEKAKISTQYIAMIELSRQFPTPEVLEKIAGVFGIEAHELFAVPPTPESTLERLRQDVVSEIKQTVDEAIAQALGDKYKV